MIIALALIGVAVSPMLLDAAGIGGGGGHGGSGEMQTGEGDHGSGHETHRTGH